MVEESLEKRNTGIQLTWYFEDGNGTRVDIRQEPYFLVDHNNAAFIVFMNLVYEAVTRHNISLDTLWNTAKRYRVDYIHRKVNDNVRLCTPGSLIQTVDFFNITSSLNENVSIPLQDYFNFTSSDLNISFSLQIV